MPGTRHANLAIRATGAAMLLVMLALAVGLAASQFSGSRSRAQTEAHRAAHVVATHFHWVFQASSQALRRIEEEIVGRPERAEIGNLAQAVRDLPEGYQYSVYDAAGRLRYSSVEPASSVDVSDREYFRRLRSGERIVISPQVTERLTGRQVFIVARRLERDGRFAGAATIAIPQGTLSDLAGALGLVGGSTISLVRTDGMLISRAPAVEPMNLAGTPLFDALKRSRDGVYDNISPADGARRIIGYWTLEGWPVIAVAGVSKERAYSAVLRHWALAMVILAPVILFAAWLVSRVTRLLRLDERRQKELQAANERAGFLLREIHHRVKNNLQTVMSLLRLEKLPAESMRRLELRIEAMVKVHEDMYYSGRFESVSLRPYLTRLVQGIANSHATDVGLEIEIADMELGGDRAMQLGLLTNELVSNAYKHAFGPRGQGRLQVLLREAAPGCLRLEVTDDGPGYGQIPEVDHMGSRLVLAFAEQLGGKVTMHTNGHVRVTLDFPKDYGN